MSTTAIVILVAIGLVIMMDEVVGHVTKRTPTDRTRVHHSLAT